MLSGDPLQGSCCVGLDMVQDPFEVVCGYNFRFLNSHRLDGKFMHENFCATGYAKVNTDFECTGLAKLCKTAASVRFWMIYR